MEVKDNLLQLDKVVQDLNKRLDENIDRIDRLSVVYNKFSKESANTPSQYVNVLNDTKKAVEDLTNSSVELSKEEQKLLKNKREVNATLRSEIATRKAQTAEIERSEKALAKENAKLNAALSLQNKTNAQLKIVQTAYDNLAIKKARYNNLTENEEKRLTTLTNTLQKYRSIQDGVNTTVGKFQQRVGAYVQSGFNPLSNSINQLSREMPAFTNSVQTGFMAISNNLPIFFDAMGGVIAQNKELQAQGKPTKSALLQLAGAFFSLGTVLSVGVTLLTIYGKDIVEFASNLMKGENAINAMAESQKAMNDISTEARKNSAEEVTNMKLLLGVAKDTSLSYQERMIAVKKLQETYPAYFGNLTKEKILAGETAAAELELTNAILSRAKANAAVTKITENQSKIIDLELEALEKQKNIIKLRADVKRGEAVQSQTIGGGTVAGTYDLSTTAVTKLASATSSLNKINAEKDALTKINNTLTTFALENEKKSILLKDKNTKSTKENTKAIKDNKEKQEEQLNFGTSKWLDAQISNLKTLKDTTATTNEQSKEIEGAIKYYEQWKDSIDGVNKSSKELNDTQEEFTIQIPELDVDIFDKISKDKEELSKWLDDFKGKFKDDFVSNSGFSKLFDLFENFDKLKTDGVATALAISEAFQEAFNTISNASKENFDAEYSRLEQQKSISLQFAGESSAAKQEIERQYEEKRKAIQKREAEAQKRLAIFNIAVNTAQAIVAAVAKSPLTFGLPFSAIAAAIGAAQIAMVSSQQIPQFWKGTDNAPEGLAWTQEKGAEVITDKKGNVKTYGSNKGAQLTYLNKGDKVYKSHEDYINKELSKSGIQPIGQSFSSVNISNGLTKEDLTEQITRLSRTISQKENININIDKSGFRAAVNGKEYLNNRLTLKGRNV